MVADVLVHKISEAILERGKSGLSSMMVVVAVDLIHTAIESVDNVHVVYSFQLKGAGYSFFII